MQQRDLRSVDGHTSNVQALRENQRQDLHADVKGFSGEKRRGAEFGIVADGEVIGRERASDERETEIPKLHLASQRCGSFLFDGRAELIDGDQERNNKNQNNQDTNDDKHDAELAPHDDLQNGRNSRWPGRGKRMIAQPLN